MEELTIEAKIENLTNVKKFITSALKEKDCSIKIIMQMELVVEEIFVNVANYAYSPKVGNVTLQRIFENTPPSIKITFIDGGVEFNPLEKDDPNINADIDERNIGGLGIFLIKKIVDEISYERKDGKNILKIKKLF